jgi:hypothetical protein
MLNCAIAWIITIRELTRQWSLEKERGGTRIVKKAKEKNRYAIFKRRKSPGIDSANFKE